MSAISTIPHVNAQPKFTIAALLDTSENSTPDKNSTRASEEIAIKVIASFQSIEQKQECQFKERNVQRGVKRTHVEDLESSSEEIKFNSKRKRNDAGVLDGSQEKRKQAFEKLKSQAARLEFEKLKSQANEAFSQQKWNDAIRCCSEALALNSSDTDIVFLRAMSQFNFEDQKKAFQDLTGLCKEIKKRSIN